MLKSSASCLVSSRALCLAGLVLVALMIPLLATAGVYDWTSVGPRGGPVTSFAVAPSAPHMIYAWNRKPLWRTDNRGTTWREVERGEVGEVLEPVGELGELVVSEVERGEMYPLESGNGGWLSEKTENWIQCGIRDPSR